MFWQKLPIEALRPKYALNGFPKSGLHLCEGLLAPVVHAQPADGLFRDCWVGTFNGNAWTNEWLPLRTITYRLARVQAGRYVKGHLGWSHDVEQFLYLTGAAVVFVYRDLRDVAVSQAHHILNADDVHYKHPDKGIFQRLGSFNEALNAVIEGIGPYPGVIERWEQYAPWLECEWVCPMRFETMREEPEQAARTLLEYGLRRVAGSVGLELRLEAADVEQVVAQMVATAAKRGLSPTFRRGEVGEWREAFTAEQVALWKKHDGTDWLTRLGYEEW